MTLPKTLALASVLVAVTANVGAAQAPAYDDGYVIFGVENHETREDGETVDAGWSLKAWGRVLAHVPRSSALVYVVKSGGQERARFRCRLENEQRAPFEMSRVRECTNDEALVQGSGAFEVEVHYVDGNSDRDTVVAQHTIEVLQSTQTGRATTHYVNQNGEAARAIVGRSGRHRSFSGRGSGSGNALEIVTFAAPSEYNRREERSLQMTNANELMVRCTVDGARLEMESTLDYAGQDEIDNVYHGENERVRYSRVHYILKVGWGPDSDTNSLWPTLQDNPGAWVCHIRSEEGDISRTFSFTVRGGDVVAHPEESNDFTIGAGAHLAEVSIANNQLFETRVDPAAPGRLGISYGHQLQSPGMRSAVRALPSLGDATVEQPASRRRRRR